MESEFFRKIQGAHTTKTDGKICHQNRNRLVQPTQEQALHQVLPMTAFVSQGHQHSIGLEVFLKSISLLSEKDRKLFHLVGFRPAIEETLESINADLNLTGLTYHHLQPSDISQSLQALEYCLDNIKPRDILLTLPTSKDQLPDDAGHSQFFRRLYDKEDIAMVFEFSGEQILLITDHIPLRDVPRTIDPSLIVSKVKTTLNGYVSLDMPVDEVLFAGINPHAGEGGLLGKEDNVVTQAAKKLQKEFPRIHFSDPISADALHFHKKDHSNQLFVYMYHDQGLPKFKNEHGTLGVHLTFGLPFLRMSVDHGTAFNLYKKDCANYIGMYHLFEPGARMSLKEIIVTKANVHNLKSVSTRIPKNTLTVITGPSGSGKSSLAFDTIFVEGQRRYIESLSSYARQFLGQHNPPDVESIEGLSPSIAIDQKSTGKNPRSTVGTITEIFDYLRILYARVGTLYCPETGEEVRSYTPHQIVKTLTEHPDKTKIQLLAPLSSHKSDIANLMEVGMEKFRLNGEFLRHEELPKSFKESDRLEAVTDRLLIKEGVQKRMADSVEYTLKWGRGHLTALVGNQQAEHFFSQYNKAPHSDKVYPELEPRLFSFNSPLGACPVCNGIGESKVFDKNTLLCDPELPLLDGAIGPLTGNRYLRQLVASMAETEGIDVGLPYKKIPKRFINILFNGSRKKYHVVFESEYSSWTSYKSFPGITKWLEEKYHNSTSERVRKYLEQWMRIRVCPVCSGKRLNPTALSTRVNGKNIMDISSISIEDTLKFIQSLKFDGEKKIISNKILAEINNRIQFLIDVGLGYLTLNRPAVSLSGGESQRIRLATQIGSALSGVLYVLDEPSIGLHQRDNSKLINTLKSLRDIGNTVLVVEHDEEMIRESDYVIDIGPGAGIKGGEIVQEGKTKAFARKTSRSITAQYLSGKKTIPVPSKRRTFEQTIKLTGATHNNLNKLNVEIPLGIFAAITGVSGSGKSTLMHEIFVPACCHELAPHYYDDFEIKDRYQSIQGVEHIDSIIELDQSPIGRTPKSNPATYTKVFDEIRSLYARTPESRARGYLPGRFSFNVKGGRCEECEGNGVKSIEMHFLPDVHVTCQECRGKRYNQETLSILYKGNNISDILNLSVTEALEFFKNHKKINRILTTLESVGLGYIKLGQSATTLSGGEAQRLKLSRELAKNARGRCLYVLDEPTTGLHFEDIKVLLQSLEKLIQQGHTVLVIEHNLDVIKFADYIIDLGPEGGSGGGKIVAKGTPEEVAANKRSHTGEYLKRVL